MRITDCFLGNQEEALHNNVHQNWYRLVTSDLGRNHSEAVIHCLSWRKDSARVQRETGCPPTNSCGNQDGVIGLNCRVFKRGQNVGLFEKRIIFQNFLL